jgi:hypothetical protein
MSVRNGLAFGKEREEAFKRIIQGVYTKGQPTSFGGRSGSIVHDTGKDWAFEFAKDCWMIIPAESAGQLKALHAANPDPDDVTRMTPWELTSYARKLPHSFTRHRPKVELEGGAEPAFDLDLVYADCHADAFVQNLTSGGDRLLVEVKCHLTCRESGNVAVEFDQLDHTTGGQKPSGIALSQAHYYVHEFVRGFWIVMPISWQHKMLEEGELHNIWKAYGCGDRNNSNHIIHVGSMVHYLQEKAPIATLAVA